MLALGGLCFRDCFAIGIHSCESEAVAKAKLNHGSISFDSFDNAISILRASNVFTPKYILLSTNIQRMSQTKFFNQGLLKTHR